MVTKAAPVLSAEQVAEVLGLIKGADSVELKLTVPDGDRRSAVAASAWMCSTPQIRQVVFFDTPDLALDKHGRRGAGAADPGQAGRLGRQAAAGRPRRRAAEAPQVAELRRRGRRHAGRLRLLGFDEGRARSGEGEGGVRRPAPDSKLFTKEQRAFYTDHAPEGLELDDLSMLGPINVLKLKFTPGELRPPDRGRAVVLPRRIAHPRALDEVRARRGLRRRRRDQGVPRGARASISPGSSRPRPRRRWSTSPASSKPQHRARAIGSAGSASTPRR